MSGQGPGLPRGRVPRGCTGRQTAVQCCLQEIIHVPTVVLTLMGVCQASPLPDPLLPIPMGRLFFAKPTDQLNAQQY